MIIIAICISATYLGVCAYLSSGLKKLSKKQKFSPCKKSVSVIICARNEEKNIAKLLDCLILQSYPKELTQIIIIDDRSTDKTAEKVLSYKEKLENLQMIKIENLEARIAPKKNAFFAGMKLVTGEIIVQTDADSIVPSDWIEKLTAPFSDENIALVQGIVKYRFDDKISPILRIYQTLDFASHGIVAAAAINKNIPLNANANNFAFRKITYDKVGGYGHLNGAVAGNDGLIMQNFWINGKKIYFNAETTVETQPEYSWKNLINQRKKWSSQTTSYLPKQTAILALIFIFYCFIFVFCIYSLLGILLMGKNSHFSFLIPAFFAGKIIGELLFLSKSLKFFADKKLLPHIIWVSPLNLFIVIFSVLSGIFGKFEWKGKEFGGKTN